MSTNIDKNLQKLFDLPKGEMIVQSDVEKAPKLDSVDANAEYDYEKARNNIHSLIQQGSDALQYALDIAKNSENPRAFEVFNQILKNLSDMNLQLMDTSEKYKASVGKKSGKVDTDGNINTVNNTTVFVGSNSDLNKMIENMMNKKEKDIDNGIA